MTNKSHLKQQLFKACLTLIEERIKTINESLRSISESKNNETKSSAGDKYETGRAMLQIEEENSRTQLLRAVQLKAQLEQLDLQQPLEKIGPGSLVTTNGAAYFISIGLGLVTIESKDYYCISPGSPIGKLLMDKKVGDRFEFNGSKIKIMEIC